MAQNDQNDFRNMLGNKQMISQLAQSPDAQALASLLSQGRDQSELERMAQNAVKGDTESLKTLMNSITNSPEGMDLLRRLRDSFQKK